MLAAYRKVKSHRITVVFDGAAAPAFSQKRHRRKGISIVFSHMGESADTVIKKMAGRERQKALVVSSDRDIIQSAASCGAATVSSEEFENRLTMAMGVNSVPAGADDYEGWKPTTKKKGPSRRLSRRQRKNIAKLRKL
jgi:predicted RNA-binding protein with PIN domain